MRFGEILKELSKSIEDASQDGKPYIDEWLDGTTQRQLGLILTFLLVLPIRMLQNRIQQNNFDPLNMSERIAMEIYKAIRMVISSGEAPLIKDLLRDIIPMDTPLESFDDIVRAIYPEGHAMLGKKLTSVDFEDYMENFVSKKYGDTKLSYAMLTDDIKDYVDTLLMSDKIDC